VRAGGEGKSATLEVWGGSRLLKELQVCLQQIVAYNVFSAISFIQQTTSSCSSVQLRLTPEVFQVPKMLHGSIYNDGWFGSGAAWSPDEGRLAYVAEVLVLCAVKSPTR
jgi:Acylamino-acid-releasing enzyme, N-terminal domain